MKVSWFTGLLFLSFFNIYCKNDIVGIKMPDISQTKIVFEAYRDGDNAIFSMDVDGRNQMKLGSGYFYNLSPDGSKIVFVSERTGKPEIFVMNHDGKDPVQLTNLPNSAYLPCYSPDGSKVVFKHDAERKKADIYIMNSDGSNQIKLTNSETLDFYPSISPNGTKIVFKSTRDGNNDIFIMNMDGTNQTNLTSDIAGGHSNVNSPDGLKILFVAEKDGYVYEMNLDGGNKSRLVGNFGQVSIGALQYSHDGSKIVFAASIEGDSEIYIATRSGKNLTRLTNSVGRDYSPRFSYDASEIVFMSQRDDGDSEIYIMNSDGSNQTRLTTLGGGLPKFLFIL